MGLRGPSPTPTALLESRGSWRSKINPHEPQPTKGKPKMPRRLSKAEATIWRRLTKMLEGMRVLTIADGEQLARYCVYYLRWIECEDFITKNGLTYPMKSKDPACYVGRLPNGEAVVGFVEYPQVRESHRLDKALKQIEAAFGMTPAARTRLRAEPPKESDDPLEKLLTGKGTEN